MCIEDVIDEWSVDIVVVSVPVDDVDDVVFVDVVFVDVVSAVVREGVVVGSLDGGRVEVVTARVLRLWVVSGAFTFPTADTCFEAN